MSEVVFAFLVEGFTMVAGNLCCLGRVRDSWGHALVMANLNAPAQGNGK